KINMADNLPRSHVDDQHLVSIDAGLSHAGTAIDGQKGSAPILGSGDFMPVNTWSLLINGRNLPRRCSIDDAHIAVALVYHQQRLSFGAQRKQCEAERRQQEKLRV